MGRAENSAQKIDLAVALLAGRDGPDGVGSRAGDGGEGAAGDLADSGDSRHDEDADPDYQLLCTGVLVNHFSLHFSPPS